MRVGDKIIVIERTYNGQIFYWDGEIAQMTESFIETVHRRNASTHPQWLEFGRAYLPTYTKHYDKQNLIEK